MKDLFVNVVDKIVEQVKQYKLSHDDLNQFLTAYSQVISDGTVMLDNELKLNFLKFIKTMSLIVLTFYKS